MKKKLFKLFIIICLLFGFNPNITLAETNGAETKYSVSVTVTHDWERLSDVEVTISQNDETITFTSTNRNGIATFELSNGTYKAIVSYTRGNYLYYGETEIVVNNGNTNGTIELETKLTEAAAKEVYDNTDYFNHVDIRVNGTFTTGTEGNTSTYTITIKNVSLLVVDGETTLIDTFFDDDTEKYEWRVTEQSIPKTATVSLVFDILVNGETIRDNYTYTFAGEADFIQAIINCDQNQGLDFIIDPTEITEAAFYNVSYQWTGLPEGLATPPTKTTGYAKNDSHTIDTIWAKDTTIIDKANGKMYTFSGWETWSNATDNHQIKTNINNETITITNDTIIYGKWVSTDLDLAPSHIIITKTFINSDNNIADDLYFTITEPDNNVVKITYSSFINGSYTLSISKNGRYTIEEHNTIIPGYNFVSTTINTDLTTTNKTTTSITIDINLDYIIPTTTDQTSKLVGTISYINDYEKKTGNPVYNYPDLLIEKKDKDNNKVLPGAIFTLTPVDQTKTPIISSKTNEFGYTSFKSLQEGTYTLTETTSPQGYHKSTDEYIITVTLKNNSPQEIYEETQDAYTLVYDYIIEITPNEDYDSNTLKLNIYNKKITGNITINKEFGETSKYNKENYPTTNEIKALVTGPNNYSQTIILNATNNWKVTLDKLELGNYTIEELITSATIEGYTLNTTYNNITNKNIELTLTDEEYKEEIIITNTYIKIPKDIHNDASFSVKKVDENGNFLSGATFGLYNSNNELISSKTTDETGIITFTGFNKEAIYTLKEISAPTNYNKVATEWKIIVTLENGSPSTETGDNVYNWNITIDNNNYNEGTLIVVNELMTGSITITKEVQLLSNNEIIEKTPDVKNVKYKFTVIIGDNTYIVELADGESKTFEKIPYGTKYQIFENIPEDATWTHINPTNATGTITEEEASVNMVNTYTINHGNGGDDSEEENEDDNKNEAQDDNNNEDKDTTDNKVPQTGYDKTIYLYSLITILGMIGFILTVKKYNKNF